MKDDVGGGSVKMRILESVSLKKTADPMVHEISYPVWVLVRDGVWTPVLMSVQAEGSSANIREGL